MRQVLALLLGVLLVGQAVVAWAEPAPKESASQQAVYGAGSVLTTLVYAPIKASFCILGAVSSGFAFPIAGAKTATNIASTTCGGTWAVTPDALKGKERVKFVGGGS